MAGKSGSSTRNRSNTTGKEGNASGSRRREARGDPGGAGRGGAHPPNRLFTTPAKQRKERARVTSRARRQSDRGDNPRD